MGKLHSYLGFPFGSAGKESACHAGDLGLIPGLGRSPVEGKGYPLQYSGLENSMDCIIHRIAKSWTRLSNFHFLPSFLPQLSIFRGRLFNEWFLKNQFAMYIGLFGLRLWSIPGPFPLLLFLPQRVSQFKDYSWDFYFGIVLPLNG